ncbi:unnamed protein product [Zymoseptoria tritici ST99CH_3D7]|uniref:CBS domain-containing protein n=2 Tax=Zymoseptoria tritici TaxID=1047171 RepID=A0A1X7RTV3_ZYMT9|nr:unnamed protein product [Zymoseptoria tritici ST99CH_3D7]SMR51373.1 unnamed protein product [Zymoseptoria tritici ST99CH_1E4]
MATSTSDPTSTSAQRQPSPWANKYRGATVEDLDPPPALSTTPLTPLHQALFQATAREYTHLTVLDPTTKSLLGYISAPNLQSRLSTGELAESDPVEKAMTKFKRKGKRYRVITMETPLEELESFFAEGNEFAVVTDPGRRFVLGVVVGEDLRRFLEGRPA